MTALPFAPFGLKPIKPKLGGELRVQTFKIKSAYATSLYPGDPVILAGEDEFINIYASSGSNILGVFAGCQYDAGAGTQLTQEVWTGGTTASGTITAFVYADPDLEYEIQADATLAATDANYNCELAIGTPSAIAKKSGAYLDASEKATTATLPVRILGISNLEGATQYTNAFGDTYPVVRVRLNTSQLRDTTGV